jgi:small-conductance mechanosensitive channel
MSLFSKSWSYLLLILILSWPLLLASEGIVAQEKQKEVPASEELEPIRQAETEAFQQQKQIIQGVQEELPELVQKFQARHQELVPELNRLFRLKGFVGDNFKELIFMRQFVERLSQEHKQSLAPLQEELQKVQQAHSRLKSQKDDLLERIQMDSAFARTQAQQERLQAYNSMLAKSEQLQAKLKSTLEISREFSQRLDSVQSSLQKDLDTAWKTYFFSQDASVLDLSLKGLLQDLQEWRQGLPVYFSFFFIGQMPWAKFLSYALLLAGALIVVSLFVLRKLRHHLAQIGLKDLLLPLILIYLSLGLWAVTTFLPQAFQSVLLLVLIQILLFHGLAGLFWRLRLMAKTEPLQGAAPLSPLWWLFSSSLVLQGLNLPSSLLVLVWPAILLFFFFWLLKACKGVQLGLERIILISGWIFLLGLGLAALMGAVNISLLLGAFLFVLALSMQFAALAADLLRARVALLPDSNLGYLGQGLIQGTGVPLLWILSILAATTWLGVNMGDVHFLKEITSLDLGWGAISINMFRLILVLIGFYIARSGLVILRSIMDSMAAVREHLDAGTTATLKTLITYVVWAIYLVLALAFLGLNLTSLTVVAGGLSVGIGFGMQSIVNNFISGLILLFGRAIKPGDIIQVEDLWAEVQEVNIRSTVVETFDKSTLLLPNSMLIEKQITNWTLSDKTIRRTITVGVAYGSDIELVKRLLQYIAETHPEVLNKPLPFVRFADFGSSALIFTLYFFASIDKAWDIESALRFEIEQIFREYGIRIAFQQQDLHIKSASGLEELFERSRPKQQEAAEPESS